MRSKEKIDFSPKGYLIRYPFLADACVRRFVDDFQDSFKRTEDGRYKLKRTPSLKKLELLFEDYLNDEIKKLIESNNIEISKLRTERIIIADSGAERRKTFAMLESDIDISLDKIEKVLNSIFNKRMSKRPCDPNFIYCKHKMMLASDWIGVLQKKVFGQKNLTILDEEYTPSCVVEIEKEISELSKKENSLIVQESSAWVLSSF